MKTFFSRPGFQLPIILAAILATSSASIAQDAKVDNWNGFQRTHFKIDNHSAWVVKPKTAIVGNPWIWRARFPSYHASMDQELVKRGFHLGYVDVAGLFGSPEAMQRGKLFYDHVVKQFALSAAPAMEGVSRGGLFVYNWVSLHPQLVSCIYCDTPVCDFKSWPLGSGSGIGSAAAWKQCLQAWNMDEATALKFGGNPVDDFSAVAEAKIPILHIVSESDKVVPPVENTYLLQKHLQAAGHDMDIISVPQGTEKSHGHHFTHPEPNRVVEFIQKHAAVPMGDPGTELDLYLLIGQSNMAGRGRVTDEDLSVQPRVVKFNKQQKWELASDPLHFDKPGITGVGPGRSFAIAVSTAQPNAAIGLIPCAVGGSSISTWQPGGFHKQTKSHPWDDMLKRTKAALKHGRLRGILWHQGESDSNSKRAKAYEKNLIDLIGRLRKEFGADVPFVIGQLGQFPERPWNEFRTMVDTAHQTIPTKIPLCAFVSSDGLTHKGDNTHFSNASARTLGKRYAEAFLKLAAP